MPMVTMPIVVLVGLTGLRRFRDLGGVTADQVLPMLLRDWAQDSLWTYIMAVLVVTGILAAIMSTADSVLLSLSSILSKDFLGKKFLRNASSERLTVIGQRISWVLIAGLATIAFSPRMTLWGLIELKMEILVQVSPVFVLGAIWDRLTARAALVGISVGALLTSASVLMGVRSLWGFHSGLLAWVVNVALCVFLSTLHNQHRLPREQSRHG